MWRICHASQWNTAQTTLKTVLGTFHSWSSPDLRLETWGDIAKLEPAWQIQTARSTLRLLPVRWETTQASARDHAGKGQLLSPEQAGCLSGVCPGLCWGTMSWGGAGCHRRPGLGRVCRAVGMAAAPAQACGGLPVSYSAQGALAASAPFSASGEQATVQCKHKIKLLKATELHPCKTWVKEMPLISCGTTGNRAWAALGAGLLVSRMFVLWVRKVTFLYQLMNTCSLLPYLLSACGLSEHFDSHCTEAIWYHCLSSVR